MKLPSDVGPVLIIVSRDHSWLTQILKDELGNDDRVEVIVDRRFTERRRQSVPPALERRRQDRRQKDIKSALHSRGWALVRYESPSSIVTPPWLAPEVESRQADA